MTQEMKKGWFVGFIIALFLTNIVNMCDQAIIPVINNIYEAFPNNLNLVNFIVTGSLIIYILTSMLCGKLMQKFSKKMLIVVSFGIFTLAEIFCVAIDSAVYMAIMRGIIAACLGIVNVAGVAMLADAFTDEGRRSKYMGFFNASMAIVGAAISFVAGILALVAWQNVFKVFYICIPVFVLLIIFLPYHRPEKFKADESEAREPIDLKKFIPFLISVLIFVSVFMVYQYMMSVYIAENELGDASFVGLCAALLTITSAVFCSLFGLTYSKLKGFAYIPSFLILALAYLLLLLFPGKAIALICSALMGGAFGNGLSFIFMEATVIVPVSQISTAVALVTAVQGAGMFITTYIVTLCMSVMQTDSLTATFPVYIGLACLGLIYAFVNALKSKKIGIATEE